MHVIKLKTVGQHTAILIHPVFPDDIGNHY